MLVLSLEFLNFSIDTFANRQDQKSNILSALFSNIELIQSVADHRKTFSAEKHLQINVEQIESTNGLPQKSLLVFSKCTKLSPYLAYFLPIPVQLSLLIFRACTPCFASFRHLDAKLKSSSAKKRENRSHWFVSVVLKKLIKQCSHLIVCGGEEKEGQGRGGDKPSQLYTIQ